MARGVDKEGAEVDDGQHQESNTAGEGLASDKGAKGSEKASGAVSKASQPSDMAQTTSAGEECFRDASFSKHALF